MESPKPEEKTTVIGLLRKVWQYRKLLIVEPLLVCWLLPACLLIVTIQNLSLEKACRVNLKYDAQVCISMLDKEMYGIDCDSLGISENTTEIVKNETLVTLENITESMDLNHMVCKAEIETQKQLAYINAIRGPMSSVFPIIVILFAGGWSDRKGLRKPCMLFPMFGELLSMIGLLISSIYMDVIPMEFGAIVERVVPSMLGGQTLMIMGIYSYLTEITEENDRAFRFGIFAICSHIIQLVGVPFSGTLHIELGYVKMCILAACIQLLGILYLIFFMPEIKRKPKSEESNGTVNQTLDSDGKPIPTLELGEKKGVTPDSEPATRRKNCLVDFFDPTSAYECVEIIIRKRPHNLRSYIILLIILQILFIAPAIAEADYYYNFQLLQLKWNGEAYSYYNTYAAALNIVGTFLMTAVLIKFFKLSDAMSGFIASLGTVISKPMLAFSKDSILFYIGTTVDIFISCKAIAVKSIISVFVEAEELGRLFSVLGIAEALSGFIFPPMYSQVYSSTIDSFPGAVFLFSEIFLVPTLFIFMATYFYLKKQAKNQTNGTVENGIDNPAMEEIESTRV